MEQKVNAKCIKCGEDLGIPVGRFCPKCIPIFFIPENKGYLG